MTSVGISLPQAGRHVEATVVKGFAQRAEGVGFDSLWVQERLLRPVEVGSRYAGVGKEIPADYACVLAPTELLAAVAAWTEHVRLGTSVLITGYHRPVELAKRLATIDVLSGGRLTVGLGVGWSEEEHLVSDVDPRTRGARSEEFVEALLACWGADPVSYDGDFFRIPASEIGPKPVQHPRPPLVFGMWSEPGLDRTARLADGWNPSGHGLKWVQARVEELRARRPEHLPPLTVHQRLFLQPPVPTLPALTVEQLTEQAVACAEAGLDEVIVELSLWTRIDSPSAWLEVADELSSVVGAVKAASRS